MKIFKYSLFLFLILLLSCSDVTNNSNSDDTLLVKLENDKTFQELVKINQELVSESILKEEVNITEMQSNLHKLNNKDDIIKIIDSNFENGDFIYDKIEKSYILGEELKERYPEIRLLNDEEIENIVTEAVLSIPFDDSTNIQYRSNCLASYENDKEGCDTQAIIAAVACGLTVPALPAALLCGAIVSAAHAACVRHARKSFQICFYEG